MTADNTLMHYASQYYDPVKAHEYYEQHKKLKGRKTSSLNDEGKKVWEVTKGNIKAEKSAKQEELTKNRETLTEQHRANATAARERITAKIKALNEKLSESTNAQIKKLQEQTIPKGVSKETRARLTAEKKEKIAKLRGESKTERNKNSESGRSERTQVATDLKNVVAATREAYKKAKTDLDSSYEDIYQSEFDKIAAAYPNLGKKSGSGSNSASKAADEAAHKERIAKKKAAQ
jgi:hypothetical protein